MFARLRLRVASMYEILYDLCPGMSGTASIVIFRKTTKAKSHTYMRECARRTALMGEFDGVKGFSRWQIEKFVGHFGSR